MSCNPCVNSTQGRQRKARDSPFGGEDFILGHHLLISQPRSRTVKSWATTNEQFNFQDGVFTATTIGLIIVDKHIRTRRSRMLLEARGELHLGTTRTRQLQLNNKIDLKPKSSTKDSTAVHNNTQSLLSRLSYTGSMQGEEPYPRSAFREASRSPGRTWCNEPGDLVEARAMDDLIIDHDFLQEYCLLYLSIRFIMAGISLSVIAL
ncbi:hypothetical protein QBC37DRAFT_406333 [Rhypophila decipiens]|uniref:Uncharacterized protein n=1 Tax=Rhypophila decipiens TaxID=261697 RepID=A0AAN6Y0Z1_9PEZI|nr:hypothetical protein QBC37DRAFT_406333 [Rhypophila decipiens]